MSMLMESRPLGEPTNWPAYYRALEREAHIPDACAETIDGNHACFRAMALDLGEIKTRLTQSGFDPPLVTVYADVLTIPDGLNWLLAGAVLQIIARRVQVGAAAEFALDFRTNQTAALVVFANEWAGELTGVAVTASSSGAAKRFMIDAVPASGGLQIAYKDAAAVQLALSRAQGLPMQPTAEFESALRTQFIFGSVLYDQAPDIALGIMAWLKDWAGESNDLLGLFLRSSDLLALLSAQIGAQKNGAAFVPYLTQQVYTDLAAAFVKEAAQYESDYMSLSTQKVLTDNDIKLAKTLLDNKTYENAYVGQLLVQAKANFDNALAAATAARENFDHAQIQVILAKADFEKIGIPEWEREQIAKAVISMASALITFGVGIASMLVGNEAGAAGAAAGVAEGAKAVEQAAKAGTEIAKLAQSLKDVMAKLKKIVEALGKVYAFLQQEVAAAQNLSGAEKFVAKMKQLELDNSGVDLSATYEWQIYQLNSDAALKAPIEKGVGYAEALKLAIDALAIYGQALAAAQLAVVKAGQAYTRVLLQKQLAEREQKRLVEYVDQLKTGDAAIGAMMQLFYQRLLDAKSSLFTALEEYRAAFFYWALEPSTIRPKVIDSVTGIDAGLKDITAIVLDKQTALQRFSPPPQTMTQKRVTITDPDVLASLRKTGRASWPLPLSESPFYGLDRVRLTRVRVWVEGAKPGTSGSVHVIISTAGNYLDRYQDTPYQFTAKPLQRGFEYRVTKTRQGPPDWTFDNGTFGYIEVDGSVDKEVSYAYFEPTPFAE